MPKPIKTLIVLDPLIDTENLIAPFRAKGVQLFSLYSGAWDNGPLAAHGKPNPLFDKAFDLRKMSRSELAAQIADVELIGIIPGCEDSVQIYDQLCTEFTPEFANNPTTSTRRSDKAAMQQALAANKDNAVLTKTLDLHSLDETIFQELTFPVFIRPSAGTGGNIFVKKCKDPDSLRQAHANYPQAATLLANKSPLIVQPHLEGTEYVVDTVSRKGAHKIVGMYVYDTERIGELPIVRSIESLPAGSPEAENCIQFSQTVLNALEMFNGAAHIELMQTASGMYLIELNARHCGAFGLPNVASKKVYGRSQAQLLQECLLEPKTFFNYSAAPNSTGHAKMLTLYVRSNRQVKKVDESKLKQLESYSCFVQAATGYAQYPPRSQLTDTVCFLLLYNADYEKLAADCATVFEMETQELLF